MRSNTRYYTPAKTNHKAEMAKMPKKPVLSMEEYGMARVVSDPHGFEQMGEEAARGLVGPQIGSYFNQCG